MDKYNLYVYDNMSVESYNQQKLSSVNKVVEKAKEKIGCKYVWGAGHSMNEIKNSHCSTFDCSSLYAGRIIRRG